MVETGRKRRPYAARMPMADRRTQLLDAALRVIVRDGYEKVSMDAVAREAGVTRPVVYGAFDNFETLLMALLDRQQAIGVRQLRAATPSELPRADVGEAVHASVVALFNMVLDDPLTWRPILFAFRDAPDVVAERVQAEWDSVRATVETIIAAVLPEGSAVDPEVGSHIVMASLEHFGRLLISDPQRFTPEQVAETASALIRPLLAP